MMTDQTSITAVVDTAPQRFRVNDQLTYCFVDTEQSLVNLIDASADLPTSPPSLYVDVEGINLSRHGSISILQILVAPENCVYLVDVHTLGASTFSTTGKGGLTLKIILESEAYPTVFFDVRNDSDALYSHFQIDLAGVQDLQLMELATRTFSKRCVNGLARCIDGDAGLTYTEKTEWEAVKRAGRKLFAPELGGSYDVFNVRPLSPEISSYCVQDVQYMPRLWNRYHPKLNTKWTGMVHSATLERIEASHSPAFNGKGRHMALGPWPVGSPEKRRNWGGI